MATLETLARRLETTEDLQSIVRTMKALAAVSIRQYERAADALADYDRTVTLGLRAVIAAEGRQVLAPGGGEAGSGGPAALVVVGSDHGLCGRFNEQAAECAADRHARLAERPGAGPVPVLAVGARVEARLDGLGLAPARALALPGSAAGLSEAVTDIVLALDRWRQDRGIVRVELVHNARAEAAPARPVHRALLPIDPADLVDAAAAEDPDDRGEPTPRRGRPWAGRGVPMLGMPTADLLAHLARQRLFVVLNRALAESAAAEQAARLSSMQAAERNIREHLDDMRRTYRSTRQAEITAELMDVVAGAEALSGR
jgi:F-type H+-transporting ATPase subunit gamma